MSDDDTNDENEGKKGPDPFFWFNVLALGIGIVAAVAAPQKAPSWALDASSFYRAELGLAAFAITYIVGLAVLLSYQGRSMGQLSVASVGATLPDPDPDLAEAQSGFKTFETDARKRLDAADDSFLVIDQRLGVLEAAVGAPLGDVSLITKALQAAQAGDQAEAEKMLDELEKTASESWSSLREAVRGISSSS